MGKTQSRRHTHEPEVIEEIELRDLDALRLVCGERDRNLRDIEGRFRVTLHPRGNQIRIIGERSSVDDATRTIQAMYDDAVDGREVTVPTVATGGIAGESPLESAPGDVVLVTFQNKKLGPRTETQKDYIRSISEHNIVFALGPAGTGKTYLAVLMAVQQLLAGAVNRIILARPAVEAGEKLGFLPGDLAEKVNPYLRPLYDALHDMLPFDRVTQMIESGVIEVAPLAFMRGRTLNNAFIILDEAQNSTPEQMKMFLTRIGHSSQVVVTGDVTQTDLPRHRTSGLQDAVRVLSPIPEIDVIHFKQTDVVRHSIVQKVIDAYQQDEDQRAPTLPLDVES